VLLDAADLDDSVRLAVAAQVGYSETAFVEAQGGHGQYRMRFFSALAEVAFCGHATIAAAVAIADRDGPGLIQFSTLSGLVTVQTRVTAEGTTATLTSVPTRTRTRPAQAGELDWALAALRWHHSDLDPRHPAHVAYGGNEHLVLAVRERSLLAALDYGFSSLGTLVAQQAWTTVQLVWAEARTVFHGRDPFPPGGLIEDPLPVPLPPRSADTYVGWAWSTCPQTSRSCRARTWVTPAVSSST
jgi:PhzF family phenazine biosynthesis protein